MGKIRFRYIVEDIDAAVEFYKHTLDFQLDMRPGPGFAALSKEGVQLLLNQPGAGGAGQAAKGGEKPSSGGWNRIQIEVEDLPAVVAKLQHAGCRFRTELVTGRGGSQILLEDPSGNPVELFQPA